MGYFQTILFVRDFNSKKCTDRNFIVLFPNFFDSGVNFLRRKFLREMFFARTFFLRIAEKNRDTGHLRKKL